MYAIKNEETYNFVRKGSTPHNPIDDVPTQNFMKFDPILFEHIDDAQIFAFSMPFKASVEKVTVWDTGGYEEWLRQKHPETIVMVSPIAADLNASETPAH